MRGIQKGQSKRRNHRQIQGFRSSFACDGASCPILTPRQPKSCGGCSCAEPYTTSHSEMLNQRVEARFVFGREAGEFHAKAVVRNAANDAIRFDLDFRIEQFYVKQRAIGNGAIGSDKHAAETDYRDIAVKIRSRPLSDRADAMLIGHT